MDSTLGASMLNLRAQAPQVSLFLFLLCACIVIGSLFRKRSWLNESIIALVIGLVSGGLILLTTGGKSSLIVEFDEKLFFIYLLPPIIFNAGFQVKKKQFFLNFLPITLFGAVGSLISFLIISLGSLHLFKILNLGVSDIHNCFALGVILTATDSVCTLQVLNQDETPLLYNLVFGEGVVNDATSVLLFHAIQKFDHSHITSTNAIQFVGNFCNLFLQSTLLGLAVGLLSAYIIKKLYSVRPSTYHEPALMILMAYLAYMVSEMLLLSGILSVFFCGIVMSHYTSESSRQTTGHIFATLSSVSEIFIFFHVGMGALDIEKWTVVRTCPGTSIGVVLILLGLVLVGRAAFVFPLSFILNLARESNPEKIRFKQQVTIWWAGLMRGAVSVALAYKQFTKSGQNQPPESSIMITSTITIVLFTNVVCGLFTKPLIKYMLPQHEDKDSTPYGDLPILQPLSYPLLPGDGEPKMDDGWEMPRLANLQLSRTLVPSFHYYWEMLDNRLMRPVFGGRDYS